MRRLSFLLTMFLALSACAPALKGPVAPIAAEQLDAGSGVDVVAARQTVVDFLNAYANANQDGGAALARLVGTRKLADWVHWLNVQNREFEGTMSGSVDLRSVDFVASGPVQNTLGAEIDLGASVTFSFAPAEGEPFQRTRTLDGPVTLIRAAAADWRVLDVTRDGVSMDRGIQLFKHEQQTAHGVTVRIDSLFQFTPNWQFNVVVQNRSGGDIVLDASSAALYAKQQGGGFARTEGVITHSLVQVPNGRVAEALIAFPMQDTAKREVLSIPYHLSSGRLVTFDFPLDGLVTPVPGPPTTASTAPVAPS